MAKKKRKKKAARKKKASRRKSSSAGEMLIVGSKTKVALKSYGLNVSGDALEGLNAVVHWYCDQAAKRCAANNRKTIRAHDFMAG